MADAGATACAALAFTGFDSLIAPVTLPTLTTDLFNPRIRSLARGNLIVVASLAVATPMSGFPHIHANPLLALPAMLCLVGLADTVRCMRKRWSWYHGGVLLCLYADLMVVSLILFFLLYPYLLTLGEAH